MLENKVSSLPVYRKVDTIDAIILTVFPFIKLFNSFAAFFLLSCFKLSLSPLTILGSLFLALSVKCCSLLSVPEKEGGMTEETFGCDDLFTVLNIVMLTGAHLFQNV